MSRWMLEKRCDAKSQAAIARRKEIDQRVIFTIIAIILSNEYSIWTIQTDFSVAIKNITVWRSEQVKWRLKCIKARLIQYVGELKYKRKQ